METDRRYLLEGLFIVVFSLGAAVFAAWLAHSGHRDDVIYRIRFAESVSGLSLGDAVKFQGVDVGTVDSMELDPDDPRKVRVDVRLHRGIPVKTDTHAMLKLRGMTGNVYIELAGGSPEAPALLAQAGEGVVPEIPADKSELATVLDQLPKVVERLTALEGQAGRVMKDVGEVAQRAKENPILNLGHRKK